MKQPKFPIYIPSKSRHKSRLTAKALESMGVPYTVVIENQQYKDYASVIDKKKLLVLDKKYQDDYDTFDGLGDTKSKGPGAARNFIWDHSIAEGHDWHWTMDDNISCFYRLNRNKTNIIVCGSAIRCMEDFCLRYKNIAMAGPNYEMFVPRKTKPPPYILNTRIYSCNLIRNDVPFRWRGRYNEDTDLSLRMLKDGWCTIQFNAFLQKKAATQTIKGGNSEAFYDKEGTFPKSAMQVKMHPDVSRLTWRFGRIHHYVDYSRFKKNKLLKRTDIEIPKGVNNYGMKLVKLNKKAVV
ncbi:MAG: hypothetical protein GY841_04365 [FCB group bacterium]|nr:hypothetical protein [FCB group bacterium]